MRVMMGQLIKHAPWQNRAWGRACLWQLANTPVQACSFQYSLVDKVVARVMETIRPDARGVTTNAVGLSVRVQDVLRLLAQARPS